MMRNTLALLAGFIVGYLTIAAGEAMVHYFYPPATRDVVFSLSVMRAYIKALPLYVHFLHMAAWMVGTALGTFMVTRLMKGMGKWQSVVLAAMFLAAIISQTVHFEYPWWTIAAASVSIPSVVFAVKNFFNAPEPNT